MYICLNVSEQRPARGHPKNVLWPSWRSTGSRLRNPAADILQDNYTIAVTVNDAYYFALTYMIMIIIAVCYQELYSLTKLLSSSCRKDSSIPDIRLQSTTF